MYVNPFWLGVWVTLTAIVMFVIIGALIHSYRESEDDDSDNQK